MLLIVSTSWHYLRIFRLKWFLKLSMIIGGRLVGIRALRANKCLWKDWIYFKYGDKFYEQTFGVQIEACVPVNFSGFFKPCVIKKSIKETVLLLKYVGDFFTILRQDEVKPFFERWREDTRVQFTCEWENNRMINFLD